MQKNIPYIIISFGVAALVSLLSFLDLYDNFEHSLLDMRFKSRGLMETRDDIVTVDIDGAALQKVGKWSPWSREKHLPLIKTAGEHGMDAFLFDFYFIEESESVLNKNDINFEDSTLTVENIKTRFPEPDKELAKASEASSMIGIKSTSLFERAFSINIW